MACLFPITALLVFLTWPAMIGEHGCGDRSAVHPRRFLQSTGATTAIHRVCFLRAVWPGLEIWPSTLRVTARHSVLQVTKHFNHPYSSATLAKAPCSGKVRLKKGLARIMRPSHAYAKRVLAAETSPIGDIAALKSGSTAGCPAAAGTMVRFSLQRRG